jgi:hypothetical protein
MTFERSPSTTVDHPTAGGGGTPRKPKGGRSVDGVPPAMAPVLGRVPLTPFVAASADLCQPVLVKRRVRLRYFVLALALVGAGAFALFWQTPGDKFEDCMVAGGAQRVSRGDQLDGVVLDWAAGRAGMAGYSRFGSDDGLATFAENIYRPGQWKYAVAATYDPNDSLYTHREERDFWRTALNDPSSLNAVYVAARPKVRDPFELVSDCDEKVNGPLFHE